MRCSARYLENVKAVLARNCKRDQPDSAADKLIDASTCFTEGGQEALYRASRAA